MAMRRDGRLVPTEVHGLTASFDEQADALVEWLLEKAHHPADVSASPVVGLALGGGLTAAQARCLSHGIDVLDRNELLALVTLLEDVAIWPLQRPELARQLVSRARATDADTLVRTREAISKAMHLRMFSWVNGVSEELNRARAAAADCVANETDPQLKADFEEALTGLEAEATALLRRHADDDE